MTPQAQLVIIIWLPIVFYFFRKFPPREAVIVSFIGGLLFLPQRAGFNLPLIPDYRGMVATCYGILIAIAVYDFKRFSSFKPGWIDLPMLIWCISPFLSSMTNGLGAYDGLNESITQTVTWGFPYLLGRLYLNSLDGLKELAINIIKGGLIYVPLVLYEGRMSPQLHNIIYGYYAHSSGIKQAVRLGGYRPMVFMIHGLMLGMWMMVVALIGFWLWRAGTVKKIWGMSMNWLTPLLIFSFIWCRSTGAYGYFIYALIIFFTAKWVKTSFPLLLLMFLICYYLFVAANGNFAGEEIVAWIADNLSPERAQSLEFRFDNEEILIEHARKQMLFGWGGWGRNRVFGENWQGDIIDTTTTDSLWIIAFGVNGMVGLTSITLTLLLPAASFCWLRYPARTWLNPQVAPAAACAVVLTLYMLDCVLNNMFNPLFPLMSGGLSGLVMKKPEKVRAKIPKLRVAKRQLVQHR